MRHDRRKADKSIVLTPEEKERQLHTVQNGKKLIFKLLSKKQSKDYSKQILDLTQKVLQLNPEFATFWNYRREILLHWIVNFEDQEGNDNHHLLCQSDQKVVSKDDSQCGPADASENEFRTIERRKLAAEKLLNAEMVFTEKALHLIAKSSCVWFHRLWCVEQSLLYQCAKLGKELSLCDEFLNLDDRNYHCWNHRLLTLLFVQFQESLYKNEISVSTIKSYVGLINTKQDGGISSIASEVKYSKSLILANFSNFSAWHLRSRYITEWTNFSVENELKWVWMGLNTEPRDLSLWQYYEWLLFRRMPTSFSVCNCVYIISQNSFIFMFSRPCALSQESEVYIYDQKQLIVGHWTPWCPKLSTVFTGFNDRVPRDTSKAQLTSFCWIWSPTESITTFSCHSGLYLSFMLRFDDLTRRATFTYGASEKLKDSVRVSWQEYCCLLQNIDHLSSTWNDSKCVICISSSCRSRSGYADLDVAEGEEERKREMAEGELRGRMECSMEFHSKGGVSRSQLYQENLKINELIELEGDCLEAHTMRVCIRDTAFPLYCIQDQEHTDTLSRLSRLDPHRSGWYESQLTKIAVKEAIVKAMACNSPMVDLSKMKATPYLTVKECSLMLGVTEISINCKKLSKRSFCLLACIPTLKVIRICDGDEISADRRIFFENAFCDRKAEVNLCFENTKT